jgi:hypothetical protein
MLLDRSWETRLLMMGSFMVRVKRKGRYNIAKKKTPLSAKTARATHVYDSIAKTMLHLLME